MPFCTSLSRYSRICWSSLEDIRGRARSSKQIRINFYSGLTDDPVACEIQRARFSAKSLPDAPNQQRETRMKLHLLAGTSLLALAAAAPAARATTFTYTGAVQSFIAPTTDTYHIVAFGGQGGAGGEGGVGGMGAEIGGDFSLTAGGVLNIYVGGAGGRGGLLIGTVF